MAERCEGNEAAEHLVNDHPQGVTIRLFRWATILEISLVRDEELRAHPSNRATFSVRTRYGWICGIGNDSEEPKVRDARVATLVDQDIVLEAKLLGGGEDADV